jgi:hypothetical protein
VKEIPLREGTVAAAKPGEENPRAQEILLSDWTLAAVQRREEERRRKEQVEPTLVALKPREGEWSAIESLVDDWNLAFRQREEERRKKEQAAEAAVVTMKQGEVAEAKIVDEQTEAARRAKDEWPGQEEAEYALRAPEDGRQKERMETRAMPKSGIVRSRGAARMIRGVLSTLTTIAIAGAIGFGAGVYITPPDNADEFRTFVNSKLEEINRLIQREWAAIEPKAKEPTHAETPPAPEVAPKEIQSVVPAQPVPEAPAEAAGQKDMPDANVAPPSATPTESSDSPPTPVPSAEPVAPVTSATPTNAENVEQPKPVAKKPPVAKPHAKPPVKKPKPKPKPAEHHPQAEPADHAPAADEPAQQ